MFEDRIIYMNDTFVPFNHATVHMMSHSFSRGSAIFEVLGFHKTAQGVAVFRLDEHIERLFRSAVLIHGEIPYSNEDLLRAVLETVKRNKLDQGLIKIFGYYPDITAAISPPHKRMEVVIIAFDPARDMATQDFSVAQGTTACISHWRKLDPRTVPVAAKVAANYLNGMMAKLDAQERGFEYGIMLDNQGFIAESGTESVFFFVNGKLLTASTENVLKSITRRSILEAAESIGVATEEGLFSPELLFQAEEIFFSCTPMKVLPVIQIEDRTMENSPGPLSTQLDTVLTEITAGRDERFKEWLCMVE